MSDPSDELIRAVTRRVVDMYTMSGFLFTALDVSNAVKQSLTTVRHRHISPVVRELFDEGAFGAKYTRTLIDVMANRKKVQAYLYHLAGTDTEAGYGEDKRSQLAIPPVSSSLQDDSAVQDDQTEVTLEVGADGRLRVPRKMLKHAKIDGDQVFAERIRSEILLRAPSFSQSPSVVKLNLAHPELLHIPSCLAEMFVSTAVVEGDQIFIRGTVQPVH